MLGISVLVFALVAVNLLTLFFLRAAGRVEEIAIRRALGAGRARVLAQLLAESVLLAGAGWILGVMLGAWGRSTPARWRASGSRSSRAGTCRPRTTPRRRVWGW